MDKAVLFPILLMAVAGAGVGMQGPINALLGRGVGGPVNAELVSFLVGTAVLALVALTLRSPVDVGQARALPWYAWIGGAFGALFVAGVTFAAPRIGITQALLITIAAQLVMAMLLDHFGAFGLTQRGISWPQVAGVILVIAGTVLFRRG